MFLKAVGRSVAAAIKQSLNDKDFPPRPITSAFNSLPVCAGNKPTTGQSCSADDTVGTVPFAVSRLAYNGNRPFGENEWVGN